MTPKSAFGRLSSLTLFRAPRDNPHDERSHGRKTRFVAEVDVLHASEPAPRRLWGNNLSEKGMFLKGCLAFRKGQRLSLRFDLKGQEIFVRSAEVIWIRENIDGKEPAGIGLHFNDIDVASEGNDSNLRDETDLDTSPPTMSATQQSVVVSKVTQVPPPRPGFAASLLPLKTPRPVTMRPQHRSVVQNLSHAVTLLRRAPQLSTPPQNRSYLSFLEPSASELLEARSERDSGKSTSNLPTMMTICFLMPRPVFTSKKPLF